MPVQYNTKNPYAFASANAQQSSSSPLPSPDACSQQPHRTMGSAGSDDAARNLNDQYGTPPLYGNGQHSGSETNLLHGTSGGGNSPVDEQGMLGREQRGSVASSYGSEAGYGNTTFNSSSLSHNPSPLGPGPGAKFGRPPSRRYQPGAFTASQSGSHLSSSDHSAADRYALPPDFKAWGGGNDDPEPDDHLHNPDPARDRHHDKAGTIFTKRGLMNVGALAILAAALLTLFAGYPIISYFEKANETTKGGFNLGGTNASGQVGYINGMRSLVDPDTPEDALYKTGTDGKTKMKLVFSDEFNTDGRSFYEGDDPYFTAVDLHYWGTGDYEWYDPAAITTANGSLIFTLSEMPEHNLNFRGGMLQSWNQFCFTGGYIEVNVSLPGAPNISGLWPAAWTMGNLGRAGYGATTDGNWPYTYDTCDVGTMPNQTWANQTGPEAALTTGVYVEQYGPALSYLPGQRLSRCTCPDSDDHPGPKHADGTWVGRSAPEIDIIEAQASNGRNAKGHVSMSSQLAPFDSGYNLTTAEGGYIFYNTTRAELNSYTGAVYQQAASGVVECDSNAYELTSGGFDTYGFEYKPGGDSDSYVTWTVSEEPQWRLNALGLGPDADTQIGQRLIPAEPMYIIMNLGMSNSFVYVNFDELTFPAHMRVDYVRVYQPENAINIGCDPPDFPTAAYIEKHYEAYHNPNLTTWTESRERGGYAQKFPGNSLKGEC